MTVLELRELIAVLPDQMQVVIPTPGDTYTTACFEQSCILGMPLENKESKDGFDIEEVFVLYPCLCHVEDIPVVPDIHENLN
jgi:hypothetical protein